MTTFLVFSITRAKEITMDKVEVNEEEIDDPFKAAIASVNPPYLGHSIVVKEDDSRRFKLKTHVVEV